MTVTKSEEVSWDHLKPEIFAAIMDFYSSGDPLFYEAQVAASKDTAIHEVSVFTEQTFCHSIIISINNQVSCILVFSLETELIYFM